ncbi:MAG: Gfo/Idh/MocA family oxidoreductase, partial [Bdellovibrionia bacterium]
MKRRNKSGTIANHCIDDQAYDNFEFMKAIIVGAGSAGNHLAHSCRKLGLEVTMTDVDPQALHRTRNEIYPARYGAWDEQIKLTGDRSCSGFDLVVIATPPDTHFKLAQEILRAGARADLVEKPFCRPD